MMALLSLRVGLSIKQGIFGSHTYFVYLELVLVRVDFSNPNAIVQKLTTITIARTTKMSAWLLNSGTVGLEDTDVPATSDKTETVPSLVLATKTSPVPES